MTTTSSLRLTKPTVGGDASTWATSLNSDMDYIDNAVNGTANINLAGLTSYTMVADGSSSDQARCMAYAFSGALTGDCTVTLPANAKYGWAINNTTGGHSVILKTGAGTQLTMSNTSTWYYFIANTVDVSWPAVGFSSILAGAGGSFVSSLGGTGYQKFPGGLIVQWGTNVVTLITGSGVPSVGIVNFPIAFPSTAFAAIIQNGDGDASSYPCYLKTNYPTTTGFQFKVPGGIPGIGVSGPSGSYRVDWVAFGQ